ncbi:hypothetical protein ABXS75_03075 [Roseburia hominis]
MNGNGIMKNISSKKIAMVAVLIVVAIFSMTVVSKIASDPANHSKTIESLDEKKATVLKLTATSTAAASAIAAIPGDATTPVANKLADLSSYFLIILMVVFVEKYLVTLTGYATFFILIPLACALLALGLCLNKNVLKLLALKVALCGLIIFFILPVSMKVTDKIEQTYESSLETTLEDAENMTEEINENTDSEGNILEKALKKIQGGISGVIEKGENLLNNFIESIAVMLVTSCVIPVVVLLFAVWLVKMLFGIQINVSPDLPKRISKKVTNRKEVKREE